MELPSTALIAAGAILAAFITGAVSFVNMIIAKDQKTSEFRQKWIDDLRDDLSRHLALIDTISQLFKHKIEIHEVSHMSREEFDNFYDSIHPEFKEMNNLYNRIRLRLNPNEHIVLLCLLKNIEDKFNDIDPERGKEDFEYIEQTVIKTLTESQKVLKNEWRRVKRGEISYILTKYSVLIVFILVILIFVLSLFNIVHFDFNVQAERS
jgi:uncharacterized integral membrane protein